MQFLQSSNHKVRFEALEPRQLRSVSSPSVQDGSDYHLSLTNGDTVVKTATLAKAVQTSLPNFTWFDGTNNNELNSQDSTNIVKAQTGGWYCWSSFTDQTLSRTNEPGEAPARYYARYAIEHGAKLVVIDNEYWKFDIRSASLAEVDHSIARMQQVVAWMRDEEPTLKIGLYGFMSMSDVNNATKWPDATHYASEGNGWYANSLPDYADSYADWQAASEYLRPLSESFDYIFPELYTTTTKQADWEHTAIATIEDSRRYGKPVIPFIWPDYHPSIGGGLGETPIPLSFWQRELDVVQQYADGGFIWTGANVNPNEPWIPSVLAHASGQSVPEADTASAQSLAVVAGASTPASSNTSSDSELRDKRLRFSESVIDALNAKS